MITKTKLLKKALSPEDQVSGWNRWQNNEYNYEKREYIYPPKPANIVILIDYYHYECYEGYGYVLGYNKDTKQFFEVHGSHCSCYELEGQWEEEYTTLDEIKIHTEKQLKALSEKDYSYSYDEETRDRLNQIKELLEI
jgi:hypothetical protein